MNDTNKLRWRSALVLYFTLLGCSPVESSATADARDTGQNIDAVEAPDAVKPDPSDQRQAANDIMAEVERTAKNAEAVVAAEIAKSEMDHSKGDDSKVDCKDGGQSTYDIKICLARKLATAEGRMRGYLAVSRERFILLVNENDDSQSERNAAIAEFDRAQEAWEAFRDAHCSSVHYESKGGTIAGVFGLGCHIQMNEVRTRVLWQDWLRYRDSTAPILPKPTSGFEDD